MKIYRCFVSGGHQGETVQHLRFHEVPTFRIFQSVRGEGREKVYPEDWLADKPASYR